MAVRVESRSAAVLVVTLDRPERRNALDAESLDILAEAIASAGPEVRVLVLRGAGGHFCAGADLTGLEDQHFAQLLQRVLRGLQEARFPTLAAVDGAALGAGTQLAVACDLRTAAPGAKFGIPAAKLGLMVNHWTVDRLAALAGPGPAAAMLLAAEVLSGTDAHRIGLVTRLGPVEDALAWADEIAELAPLTIAGHKLMLDRLGADDDDPVVAAAFTRAWASDDLREGLAAFRERREPRFEGR